MTRVATIPAEGAQLWEGCGYVLNGLPAGSRCPECGKPSDESSPALRRPPAWELPERPGGPVAALLRTTAELLFRPTRFFRALTPGVLTAQGARSVSFARIHWTIAAVLLGTTAWAHMDWYVTLGGTRQFEVFRQIPLLVGAWVAAYVFLVVLTHVAARLTTLEAGYRGLRLPLKTVLRGLHYHAAHYLPVGVLAAGTVLGYQLALWRGWASGTSGAMYLYVLSAEVVVTAAYLFSTYWTAMRNLMYANR
jgi:hypothetical protein